MTQQMDAWAAEQAAQKELKEKEAADKTKPPIPPAKILEPAPGVIDSNKVTHKDYSDNVDPLPNDDNQEDEADDKNLFA